MGLPRIMVMGIGCSLYSDEGFGIRVIQELERRYEFPEHVELVDGSLLGVRLTGYISGADHLIAVDALRNEGKPGDIYRLENPDIPKRLLKKNPVQQVDFIEAFIHCHGIDCAPQTVIFAVEPEDTTSLTCQLTPLLESKTDEVIALVISELKTLGVEYSEKGNIDHVPCNTL